MVWGTPSSRTWKSPLLRPAIGAPWESVTVVKTLTSRTFTRNVGSCFWAFGLSEPPAAESCASAGTHQASNRHKTKLPRSTRACFIANQMRIKLLWLDANRGKGLFLPPNFFGKRLAVRPDGSVFEVLLLPDGDGLLQGIDQPAAGF